MFGNTVFSIFFALKIMFADTNYIQKTMFGNTVFCIFFAFAKVNFASFFTFQKANATCRQSPFA